MNRFRQILIPQRRFNPDIPEMMDGANPDSTILRDDLKNLRTINKYFGGLRVTRDQTARLMSKVREARTIQFLDLATGSADHPIAVVKLARTFDRSVHITAVEQNPVTAAIAKEMAAPYEEIVVQQGDLFAIDWAPKSFDIVLCSLAIHHFSRDNAVRVLRLMQSIARIGFVVNDLNRSWPAAWIAWLYTHLTTRNPMTLNDSFVSVLRAFTPDELRDVAQESGMHRPQIYRHPFFRLVLVGEV